MSTTEELDRVAVWIKDWFPDTTFSRQDIRDICKGPLKGMIEDFLVPRFRTEDQTYVIRSNLYVHGQRATMPEAPGLEEEEILRKEIEKVELGKQAALKGLLEESRKLQELQEEQLQNDCTAAGLGLKRRHFANLKEAIHFSSEILEDLKPLLVTDDVVYMEKETHYESFKTIQDEAIGLFHSMFFDGLDTDSQEMVETNRKIQSLIEQVVKGGLSSKEIVQWHKDELEQARRIVTEAKNQFGKANTSPYDELAEEVQKLKLQFTREHIDLNRKNQELSNELENAEEEKQTTQLNVIGANLGTFLPVDFLKYLRKEELKSKIKKCKEISEQLGPSSNDNTLRPTRNSLNWSQSQSPLFVGPSVTQDKLEDITSGILRSWPETKAKLLEGAQKGREIIPHQFIEALKAEAPKKPVDNPQNTYFFSMPESVGMLSSCSGIEPQSCYSEEASLKALNPNSENWRLGSFVTPFNESKQVRRSDSLSNLWQQLENCSTKTGSANLEILDHLIKEAETNLNRFNPSMN